MQALEGVGKGHHRHFHPPNKVQERCMRSRELESSWAYDTQLISLTSAWVVWQLFCRVVVESWQKNKVGCRERLQWMIKYTAQNLIKNNSFWWAMEYMPGSHAWQLVEPDIIYDASLRYVQMMVVWAFIILTSMD